MRIDCHKLSSSARRPASSALRITLGKGAVAAGRAQGACRQVCGSAPPSRSSVSAKCVKTCFTSPAIPPVRPALPAAFPAEPACPPTGRAAAGGGAIHPPHRPSAHRPCRSGSAVRAFSRAAGSSAALPCACALQCPSQGQMPQAGLRGVQMVAPKSNRACAKSPGAAQAAASSMKISAALAMMGLAAGSGACDGEDSRRDSLDIAVHREHGQRKGDRADGIGGIRPDAGQCAQPLDGTRKRALRRHCLRAGVQIPAARIIAKPGPQPQHRIQGCRAQRLDGGIRSEEFRVIRDHGGDLGLLQHDLGEPDMVRIGGLPRGGAPGQMAAMGGIPG